MKEPSGYDYYFMMIKSLEDWIKFEALVFLDFNFDKQDYNKTVVNQFSIQNAII